MKHLWGKKERRPRFAYLVNPYAGEVELPPTYSDEESGDEEDHNPNRRVGTMPSSSSEEEDDAHAREEENCSIDSVTAIK